MRDEILAEDESAQLVLIAAIALAVAMVPLVLAYMQLGYNDDIRSASPPNSDEQVERTLEHGLHDAKRNLSTTYDWKERETSADEVRQRLRSTLRSVNRSGLDAGTVGIVRYNQSIAQAWARKNCPGGPNRQFGPCEAIRGIILQQRDGRTHVLGAGFEVRISTPETDSIWRTVVRPD